jgi:uncharacterized protein
MTPSYHGLPCWYELATSDLKSAEAFYGATLGWTVSDSGTPGMDYWIAKAGDAMVAGMMKAEAGQPTAWSIYFAVDNCDATAAAAIEMGATLIVPPADIPNTGRFCVLIDPQGAAFALLQPLPGGTGGAFDQQKDGHGNWNELIVPDPVKAMAFYGKLFGWTVSRSIPMGPDMTYHLIARDGLDIGGTCALPDTPPHWKPYFSVASAKAAIASVRQAGGEVIHGPDQVPGGAYTVQIADPQGVRLALVGGA